jgi:hypothetical protein
VGWLEDAWWFRKDCSWENYNEGKAWLVGGRTVVQEGLQLGQLQLVGNPGWLEDAQWFRKDCSWDNYN